MGLPRRLKHFNVFHQGVSYFGDCEEIALPKVAVKLDDYAGAGMPGAVGIDTGQVENLEIEHTYGGLVFEIFKEFGITKIDGVLLRFAGSYQRDDTGEVDAVEITVRGRHAEMDPGKAKAGDKTEFKVKSRLSYYKLTINGKDMIEIDLVNFIFKVDGTDRLAEHRKAIQK